MISEQRAYLPHEFASSFAVVREWCEHGVPAQVVIENADVGLKEEFSFAEMPTLQHKRAAIEATIVQGKMACLRVGTYHYSLANVAFTQELCILLDTGELIRVSTDVRNHPVNEFVNSTPAAFEICIRRYLDILESAALRRLRRGDAIQVWKNFEQFVDEADQAVRSKPVSMWSEIIADQIEANQD